MCSSDLRARPGEVDGVDYLFLDEETFADEVRAGAFLEWAVFAGNSYGSPKKPIEEMRASGTPVILEIEVQGARQVRKAAPDATLVFIAPPSKDALRDRLTSRGTETETELNSRLDVAEEELAAANEFDVVLINADIEACARELQRILGC